MKIRLKAPEKLEGTGIFGARGEELPVGHEMEVEKEPVAWAGRYDIISGGEGSGKTPVINPNDTKAAIYEVKEKDSGWFVVTKDGAEVTKNFRKADIEGFDAMPDEDKEAFAELHKKEA